MRGILDGLYQFCMWLAAAFLLLIGVLLVLQVLGRIIGIVVPSANEIAGFSMAASTFLALGGTLRRGEHISVQLIFQRLSARWRFFAEVWSLLFAAVVSGSFAYFATDMAINAYVFREMSSGLLPIPMWVPQTLMAVGLLVLTVALLDTLVGLVGTQSSRLLGKKHS